MPGAKGEPDGGAKMMQREIAIKGRRLDNARNIIKMIQDRKLKVQAAIQENQIRTTGKKIDDLRR
jgi:uncharacterized protein YajQ (UPF0234 family)